MTITKGNTMRARLYAVLIAMTVMACGWFHCAPPAHANPICPFPTTNFHLQISIIATGEGEFCAYPMEYTGSRNWCKAGGGGIGINFGANSNGFGGGTSGGFGAEQNDCAFRCDDGRLAYQPNPPGWWKYHIRIFMACLPINPDSPPGENPLGPPPIDPRPIPPGTIDPVGTAGDDSPQTGVVIDPTRTNPLSLSPRGR